MMLTIDCDKYLRELLNGAEIDQLYVAGCDPTMQRKMYRDAFEAVGFPKEKHIGVEIRNMDTQQAIEAIKNAVKANS